MQYVFVCVCTFSFFPDKMASVVDKEKVWEFNLRDVLRWCELMVKYQVKCTASRNLSCTLAHCVHFVLTYDGPCLMWLLMGPHVQWNLSNVVTYGTSCTVEPL